MKIIDIPRSGSYADKTSSRNRGGQYVRNRRSPVQPIGTGRRGFIRAAFGAASSAWAGLTDEQRAAWAAYADTVPYVDSLGQTIKLTGHQYFVAINTQLANLGLAQRTSPPESQEVASGITFSLHGSQTDQDLAVDASPAMPAGQYALIQFSPQISPGRSFPPSLWGNARLAPTDDEVDYGLQYVAQFGALVAGRKIIAKVTLVNEYGVTGVSQFISLIVGA